MNALVKAVDEFGFHDTPLSRTGTCATHGAFESRCRFRDAWSGCQACVTERKGAEVAQEAAKAKAAEVERWQRRIGTAGIPPRFKDRTLDSFIASTEPQRKALAFALQYADDFDGVMQTGRSALFVGKPGTGKTHLAVGIALEVMQRWDSSALFITTMRALRRVKETWTRGSEESESEAIGALVYPDLLILDEVGVQFGSETEKHLLFDVLNERYEQRKPSLLLSNLTSTEVSGYLGERIFDRLREDGGVDVVFDWASHRGKSGAGRRLD